MATGEINIMIKVEKNDFVLKKEREISVIQKELEILNKIYEFNKLIFSIQESVIDYEEWGFDVNNLNPFIKNYPLKLSLFEYSNKNIWGEEQGER
tara:strand:+ start:159 stop:443 length:285 start_codon:yes stop_codon:yes gene_type:complete